MNNQRIHDMVDILDGEYYSIGVSTGHEALANMLSDFLDGHLDGFLHDNHSNHHEFSNIVFWVIAKKWLAEKKMWQAHHHYYARN